MPLELIDTHVHLDAKDFDEDREGVIDRALELGITRFVTIGAGYGEESANRAIALAEKYRFIWAAVGLHPHDAKKEVDIENLRRLAKNPRVVAIGETGLDFFRDWAPKRLQEAWFRAQIELALELGKPIIIHSREASEECLNILSEMQAQTVGGVFHCYSEDFPFAERLRAINFLVSIPGSVTFKKAFKLHEAVKQIPLDSIMLETDAPYLAPEPYRGKRCESSFMLETAKRIASLRGITLEEVALQTTANAKRLFKIE